MAEEQEKRQYLSAERLLELSDLREEDVEVPGLGWIRLRELSAEEQLHVRRAAMDPKTKEVDEARVLRGAITAALVQPRLTPEQLAELCQLRRGAVVGFIQNYINKMNNDLPGAQEKSETTFQG